VSHSKHKTLISAIEENVAAHRGIPKMIKHLKERLKLLPSKIEGKLIHENYKSQVFSKYRLIPYRLIKLHGKLEEIISYHQFNSQ